jgi:hypothetical protein
MESGGIRAVLSAADKQRLRMPTCRIPRPGDRIAWYQPGVLQRGTLLGHTWNGEPFIKPDYGSRNRLPNFDMIRIDEPAAAVGPIWCSVGPSDIVRPTDSERARLHELADRKIPPGVMHSELLTAIWDWGFEAFLSGWSVGDVLAGSPSRDAEIVTTMPVNRLRQLIVDMYDAKRIIDGEAMWQAGCFRIGNLASIAEQYLQVRAFRYYAPGTTDAVFGASFKHDMALGTFSCCAVYYDLMNDILIDPSGLGVKDAEACLLRPVMDFGQISGEDKARIGLQLIARCMTAERDDSAGDHQLCRRYHLADDAEPLLLELVDSLKLLPAKELAANLTGKVFARMPGDEQAKWDKFHDWLKGFDRKDLWNDHIEPILEHQR